MKTQKLTIAVRPETMDGVVESVRQTLRVERGLEVSSNRVREAVREVIERKVDGLIEDLAETLTSPNRPEFRELENALANSHAKSPLSVVAIADLAPVFSGNQEFSPAKYTAMMKYIAGRGLHIYKTNLNKLLFYADLTSFYLSGSGMSGAVYYNRPFGPVADEAKPLLDELVENGEIAVAEGTKHLVAGGEPEVELSKNETRVLDWVLATYGQMGAREISNLSHEERAYKDTRPNEAIAYAYSQFLMNLPPRTLLEH